MSEKIDPNLVRHMSKLSRIELSDEQAQVLGRQLAAIIGYFDKLQELDTANVEPMAHAVELTNVLAPDVPGACLTAEQALANAPQRVEDFFCVPKVIGES